MVITSLPVLLDFIICNILDFDNNGMRHHLNFLYYITEINYIFIEFSNMVIHYYYVIL